MSVPNWPPAVPDRADCRARLAAVPRLRDRRARSPSATPATAITELGSSPSPAARSPSTIAERDARHRNRRARLDAVAGCAIAARRPRPPPPGAVLPQARASATSTSRRRPALAARPRRLGRNDRARSCWRSLRHHSGRRNSSSTTGAVTPDSARKSQDRNHTRAGRRRRGSARRRVADVRPRPPTGGGLETAPTKIGTVMSDSARESQH